MSAAVNDPNLWLSATARLIRGHVALNFGQQHAQAEADFLAGLDIYRSLGERWGLAFTLISLASLATWRGEYSTAVAQREQALVFATELGTMEDVVWSRTQLARDLWLLGEHERAQAELAHAARDAQRMGLPEVRASVAMATGELARLDGDLTTARAQLTRAVELAADLGVPAQFRSLNSTALGYLAAAEHDLAGARTQHVRALATAVSSNDAPVIANALVGLADLAMREADPTRAATLLGASLAIRGTPDRSVVDEPRTAAAARAALGDAGYDAAYRRGQSATMSTVAELAGLGDGPTSPGGETPGPPAARTPR
jgi:tetratricopeptide (TPR) repeat protein